MKTRINYITADPWWDTDVTLIPDLSNVFDLHIYCLTRYCNVKYPNKLVPNEVKMWHLVQYRADKHPSSVVCALRLFYNSFIKDRKEDTIYFVTPIDNVWFAIFVYLFFPKSRTIISSHNYIEHGDIKVGHLGKILLKLRKINYKRFSLFHFYSKLQMDMFKNDYKDKSSFYTPMPLKDFGQAHFKKKNDSKIILLFFGIIRGYKRLDWLIKAVKSVNANNLKVVIAGYASAEDQQNILKLIGNDQSFETHFGFVKNEEIPQYFSNSDFLVLPYESATQSGPSLIAINYGLPIIASDVPAFKYLIKEGKNGFLFPKDSLEDLTFLIQKISNMTLDEIYKMKMSQKIFKDNYMTSINIKGKFIDFINDNIKSKKS